MTKVKITQSLLNETIVNAIRKRLNESAETERLNELFVANKEWKRKNPTVSGSENPYPGKIRGVFLRYFYANYNLMISYSLPWKKDRIRFIAEKDDITWALYHAVFDCDSLDYCVYLFKRLVMDYYEERIYEQLENDKEHDEELYEYDIEIDAEVIRK